jgi:excisionase family DNA binding protein
LAALEPLGVEAMIEASALHTEMREQKREHGRQQVERARYEVDLARRQYDAVDPAHRLVARELERRWETALGNLQKIEAKAENQLKALETALTAQEQQRLRQLAQDLSSLWHAPTTRVQDKKRIARCLIEQVVVTVPEDGPNLQAKLHWVGGEVTPIEVAKGKTGVHRYATDPELVDLLRTLAEEFSDEQIARILHRKKYKTSKGLPFTAGRVTNLRSHYGMAGRTRGKLDRENVYTVQQAAAVLGVSRDTVVAWIEMGLLRAAQVTSGAPWRVEVTEADRRRLSAADAPEGRLPLKGAAQVLGVSQQTVLQRLKSGPLEGVRVHVGARTAWRIHVKSEAYNDQPALFG